MWKTKHKAKILTVIGGFLCYMLADGCTFSIGILYSEFLEVFHQSKASTAVLPGLIYSLPQFLGPFICPFADATGSFFGSVLGGIILASSIFLSRFVISLQIMYVTMGFLASIGLELTYASAIIAVTKGFNDKKYLGLATGITVSGSGIGVFVFNPFLNYLINIYAWQGALTIESALFLHIILAGFIFKLAVTFSTLVEHKPEKSSVKTNPDKVVRIKVQPTETNHQENGTPTSYSATVINESTEIEKKGSRHASQETLSSKPSLLFENSETDNILERSFSKGNDEPNPSIHLANNRLWQSKWKLFVENFKISFSPLMSKSFWKNKKLLTFYLISFLFGFSVVTLWTFSYNYSTTMNIDESKASLLVSLIGGGACIGQITFGILSEYVPAISLYAIGCLIAGIIVMIIWLVSSYWALAIFHFVFGFGQGVSYALFSLILLEFTSIEVYPASLGIFLFLSGCGNLMGTSISGYVYDVTGSYGYAFLISGAILILCATIAVPLIYLWKRKR
uniref:Slc16a-27 n=1 Tax=Schmidtea mediterranea TaxID=79327 RepID=A0A0H3YFA7_SCHMD|nr:slc16a-27 [Schmidtea mediterranea]